MYVKCGAYRFSRILMSSDRSLCIYAELRNAMMLDRGRHLYVGTAEYGREQSTCGTCAKEKFTQSLIFMLNNTIMILTLLITCTALTKIRGIFA